MSCDPENRSSRCTMEYRKMMNTVLDYIDGHYQEKMTVEMLAGIAHFSAYHFHRIFHSMTGETINDHIRNIRLSRAAYKLLYSQRFTVAEIALTCGFSSQSDFSRSFTAFYGMNPTRYRRDKAKKALSFDELSGNLSAKPGRETSLPEEVKSTIRTAELPDLDVIYIRCTGLSGQLKSSRIEDAFSALFRWAKPRGYTGPETAVLGVILDSPEIVPMEQCRYDVCMTVRETVQPDREIGVRKLQSGGQYAAFTFLRSGLHADDVFFSAADYMYGYWMPANGYLPDERPFLEFFRQDGASQDVWTDFYIPLKPF